MGASLLALAKSIYYGSRPVIAVIIAVIDSTVESHTSMKIFQAFFLQMKKWGL